MNGMRMADVVSGAMEVAGHMADKSDRYWLAIVALLLVALLIVAVRWLVVYLVRQSAHYEAKLETIVKDQNKTAMEMAVCVDRNTVALEQTTEMYKRIFPNITTRPLLIFLLAGALSMGGGCSLLPTERKESAGVKSAEAISTQQSLTVERTAAAVAQGGAPFRIEAHSQQEATQREALTARSITSIPMGVKLGLLAAGLLAVVFVVGIIRKYSMTANVAYEFADQKFAGAITLLKNKATLSDDHKEIAEANGQIAEFERLRGQLVAKKAGKKL